MVPASRRRIFSIRAIRTKYAQFVREGKDAIKGDGGYLAGVDGAQSSDVCTTARHQEPVCNIREGSW